MVNQCSFPPYKHKDGLWQPWVDPEGETGGLETHPPTPGKLQVANIHKVGK